MRSFSLLISVIVLTSCKYQYFSYKSALDKNSEDQFYDFDNSILVNYKFTSSGVMEINIKNKGEKDVYLDLTKSKIVFNNYAVRLHEDDSIKGPQDLPNMNASVVLYSNEGKKIRFHSLDNDFAKLRKQEFKPFRIGERKARKYTFNQENAVKKFTSHLVILSDNGQENQLFEHDFWVDEIVQTRLKKNLSSQTNEIRLETFTTAGDILGYTIAIPAAGLIGGYLRSM